MKLNKDKEEIRVEEETMEEKIIKELKKKYKYLYKNIIEGETIIWKPLNRKDYREVLKITDEDKDMTIALREEHIVKNCVVYPSIDKITTLLEEKAGIAITLSEEIMNKSGFEVSKTESV